MAKTKQPPARKPVKARGALPSPRVAPQRDTTPWHGKTKFRVLLGVVAVILIAIAVKLVMDARDRAAETRADVRAVEQFERKVQDLNLDIQPVYEALGQAPGAFLAGALPEAEFRNQANGWVESFRELNRGIRTLQIPSDIPALQEAKASYVQASTIYIDAAKIFATAPDISDPAARERAAVLARNLFLHAAAVYGMGDRFMTELKNEYELNDPPADLPAPTTPEEEVPVQPVAPEQQDPAAVAPSTDVNPAPAEASPAPAASP